MFRPACLVVCLLLACTLTSEAARKHAQPTHPPFPAQDPLLTSEENGCRVAGHLAGTMTYARDAGVPLTRQLQAIRTHFREEVQERLFLEDVAYWLWQSPKVTRPKATATVETVCLTSGTRGLQPSQRLW